MNRTTTRSLAALAAGAARRRRVRRRRRRRCRRRRHDGCRRRVTTAAAPPGRTEGTAGGAARPVGLPRPARHPDRLVPGGRARRAVRDGRRGLHRRRRQQGRQRPAGGRRRGDRDQHRDPHRRPGDRRPAGVGAAVRGRQHHLGYANTEGQVLRWDDKPVISVVAPLEINPQIIYWDPETYPDDRDPRRPRHEGRHDQRLRRRHVRRRLRRPGHLEGRPGRPVVRRQPGPLHRRGRRHRPAGLRVGRAVPYENEFTDWGKPIAFQTLHDAGFEVYSQTLSMRPGQARGAAAVPGGVRAGRPAGGDRLRRRPGAGQRDHHRRRRPVRHVLDLQTRASPTSRSRRRRSSASSATAPTTRSATWTRPGSRA